MSQKYLLTLALSFISIAIYAQTGKVAGKVLNEKNEPIVGVSVNVAGIPGGTTTDVEGRYTLVLKAGKKYEVQFSAIGYAGKTVEDVVVTAGQVTDLNLVMTVSSSNLGAVTVTASRTNLRRATVNSLLQFQKNTNTVAAVVSAEAISRSPDKNTSEVLKRVPGASIIEGRYLVIRGLADRYNQAMLNGVLLSSTEPDRKTFSYDIFPAPMIDNIIINKAFVPEYPGEWAGGLIQVNTKDIPSSDFFTVQVGTNFNTNTIGKDFYKYDGGKLDWLGFDDGTRALPDNFPLKSQFATLSSAEKIELGKQVAGNKWSVHKTSGLPSTLGQSLQLSGGFNRKLFGKDLGGILTVTYNRSIRKLDYVNKFFSINGLQADDNFNYYNEKYSQNVLWGALANFSMKLNRDNKISFKNLFNVNTANTTTLRTGKDFEASAGGVGENIRARELNFRANTFFNTILSGEHNIRSIKTKLNWYGSFGILDQYIPNQRRIQYNQDPTVTNAPYEALISGSLSQKSGSVFYSALSDYIYNAGGDVTKDFDLFSRRQSIKAGYLFQVKDRLYDARPFAINLLSDNSTLRQMDEDHIFAPENFGTADNMFGFEETAGKQYRYLANTILNAGFLQFDNQFADWLRVVWGARYEHFDQLVGSVKKSDDRFVNSKVGDFLPAVNATFKVNNLTNIRLSGSQTLVRPEFRELSNLAFYDFEVGATITGNKNLVRTKITNLDLRYEFYPRAGEVFTIGGFYKYFDTPIELKFNQSGAGSSNTFNYVNAQSAYSFGAELEFRKKLDFAAALKNFTFQGNFSYIYNRVKFENAVLDRPMQGQSPYLLNASLQYDLEKIGLNTTVLFNEIGRRILYVGNEDIPAIWEAPRPLLDVQIAKKVIQGKGIVKLNISDLINQTAKFYHDLDGNKKYTSGTDALAITRKYGTNVSISFAYTFK